MVIARADTLDELQYNVSNVERVLLMLQSTSNKRMSDVVHMSCLFNPLPLIGMNYIKVNSLNRPSRVQYTTKNKR
jgi:hypothetical protein